MRDEDIRKDTFRAVYGVDTIKEISELFKADYIEVKNNTEKIDKVLGLFQKYVLSITFLYSITSMKNNLSLFRKVITEEGGIHSETALKAFKIFDIYTVIKNDYDTNLSKKEETAKDMLFDVESEIKKVKIILQNKSYVVAKNQKEAQVRSYYLSYILGLSTGRRFTEILKTIDIRKNKNIYMFTGILKKDRTENSKTEAYLLYLSADEVKGYLKELRIFIDGKLKTTRKTTIKETEEGDINSIFSKVYNNAIKRISNENIPNFHELRHYYAIEHQELYLAQNPNLKSMGADDLETHLGLFRRKVLGHKMITDSTRPYKTIK